jgi:murein tripeptide amidase MpaA
MSRRRSREGELAVDADLDGGSIEVLGVEAFEGFNEIELSLRPDSSADFRQWFCYRVRGARGRPCSMRIVDAGEATYPAGFEGYRACASYDGERWFRVPTEFDGEQLLIEHTPARGEIVYAYFAPYPAERRRAALAFAESSDRCRVETLGRSPLGAALPLVVIGDAGRDGEGADGRLKLWVTARQHPGETMAEWYMEGLLESLLDGQDPVIEALLARATFYLVPCVNPDGGLLGNLRTNAVGTDLNRSWSAPDEQASPEVLAVRDRMEAEGVDMFLDVHGDERNPYVFAAGCEGNPGYDDRLDDLEDRFMEGLVAMNPDFQRAYGYPRDLPGEGDLSAASNWVGERFDCLSLTLEMPFKDNANLQDPARGWSPERSRRLGRETIEAALLCLDSLR